MKDKIRLICGVIKRLCMYICFLIPRSKKIYIFGAWKGEKFADNSRALFLYSIENTDKKCIWICKNRKLLHKLKSDGYNVYLSNSLLGIWYQLRAGVSFSSVGYEDFCEILLGNCINVELWHGVGGGKTIGMDDKMYRDYALSRRGKINFKIERVPLRKHYFLATSDEMKKVFKSAFGIKENHFIFAGQPRNDMFYDSSYVFKTLNKSRFGKKRVILYMPTHRMEGKQLMDCACLFDLDLLNQFCYDNNCIFVIKKHFYHFYEEENLNLYERIVDVTREPIDTNELLMITDYLISDYSSVTADYLLLNRPILYYCFDYEKYTSVDRNLYWLYEQITPGPLCKDFQELMCEMKNIIEGKDIFVDERKKVKNMFYNPKCQREASSIIIQQVNKIIERENHKMTGGR